MRNNQPSIREQPPWLLREFFITNEYDQRMVAMRPEIGATHYEIKAYVINMFSSFYGIENEPFKHLDKFLDVRGTVRINNINDDALRLCLFPFSLKEKAKH